MMKFLEVVIDHFKTLKEREREPFIMLNLVSFIGILHQLIKWTGLDFTNSIIIFSICLFAIVLSVMLGIYITCNKMETAEDVYLEVNDITEQKSMPENVTSSL